MYLRKLSALALGILASSAGSQLFASTLLIDRGLPTANLNNAAGANRSNVSWTFGSYPADSEYAGTWLVGDSFTNTSGSTYFIETIRVWTTGSTSNADLYGGLAGSLSYGSISTNYSLASITYANATTYQGTSTSFSSLNQLDFSVNLTLEAGQTFNFFLNGDTPNAPPRDIPYLHASNAALSGSTQQGSDNMMLVGLINIGDTTIAATNIESWSSSAPGGGWDKASDVNVQVFGTVPDSGSTAILLGLSALGLGICRRKRNCA